MEGRQSSAALCPHSRHNKSSQHLLRLQNAHRILWSHCHHPECGIGPEIKAPCLRRCRKDIEAQVASAAAHESYTQGWLSGGQVKKKERKNAARISFATVTAAWREGALHEESMSEWSTAFLKASCVTWESYSSEPQVFTIGRKQSAHQLQWERSTQHLPRYASSKQNSKALPLFLSYHSS